MTEWIVTSSLLILGVVVLRALLRNKISRGLQYALWLLVLARLLCPFSMPKSRTSVMTALKPLEQQTEAAAERSVSIPFVEPTPLPPETDTAPQPVQAVRALRSGSIAAGDLVRLVWLIGSVLCALWFLAVNLRFGAKLRRSRRLWKKGRLPVYVTEAVVSPCLFGLFRPAVYLTPRAVEPEVRTDHVILHETCHFRHGDHVWSALRCLCLVVHWWNPLVWLAASLSRQDGELCCDESAIRRCGDRLAYGRTLVDMVACQPSRSALICTATTMAASRRSLRERVRSIAKKPKVWIPAVIAVLLSAVILVLCLFTGAVSGARLHGDSLDSYACVSGGVEYAMPDELGEELVGLLNGCDYGPLSAYDGTPEYAMDWQFLCRSGDVENQVVQDTGGWRIIRSAPDGTTSALLPDALTESVDFSIWWKQCDSEVSAQIIAAREPDPLDAATDGAITMHFNAGYEDFPDQKETVRSLDGRAEARLREVFDKSFPTADSDAVFEPDLGFTVGGVIYEVDTVHARMETGGVRYALHYDDVNTILLTACGCLYGSETSIRPLFSRLSQLSPATETGDALFLDYADDTILIFHGEFGLFVYEWEQEAVTVAHDLVDLMGRNTVTGEASVQVRISTDGSTVMLFGQGQNGPSEGALYLDPHTGKTWSDFYGLLPDVIVSDTENPAVFLLENGTTGRLSSADGTVGSLIYEENGLTIRLFDRYFVAAASVPEPWQTPAPIRTAPWSLCPSWRMSPLSPPATSGNTQQRRNPSKSSVSTSRSLPACSGTTIPWKRAQIPFASSRRWRTPPTAKCRSRFSPTATRAARRWTIKNTGSRTRKRLSATARRPSGRRMS